MAAHLDPVEHPCPDCGTVLLLEPVHAGRSVPCPGCGGVFEAPEVLVPRPRAPGEVRFGPGQRELVLSIVGLVAATISLGCLCFLPVALLSPASLVLVLRERRKDIAAGGAPRRELLAPLVLSSVGTGLVLLLGAYFVLTAVRVGLDGSLNF